MARRVEVPTATLFRSLGRPSRYPWGEWFDGTVWLIEQDDHNLAPDMFRQIAARAAKNKGLRLRTRVTPEGVYLQAVPR